MAQPEKRQDAGEFVKHVRAVHFSLVAVTFLVVVSWAYASPTQVNRALDQLGQVEGVILVWDQLGEKVRGIELPGLWIPEGSVMVGQDAYSLAASRAEVVASACECMTHKPSSIEEFREWWGSLRSLRYPAAGDEPRVLIWDVSKSVFFERLRVQIEGGTLFESALLEDAPRSGLSAVEVPMTWVRRRPLLEWPSAFPDVDLAESSVFSGEPEKHDLFVVGEVRTYDASADVVRLMGEYNVDVGLGRFASSFKELNELTTLFQDEPFAVARKELERISRVAGERWEVFGAKVPVSAVAVWGIAVIGVIQAYLYLHVAALFRLLRKGVGAGMVPWVGLYGRGLSLLAALVSACVLPVAVVALIAVASCVQESGGSSLLTLLVSVPFSVTAATATGALLWRAPLAMDIYGVRGPGNLGTLRSEPALFRIEKCRGGRFIFRLVAGDGVVVLASGRYKAMASVERGIASVRRNAPNEDRYERKSSAAGEPYFVLKAANHEILGESEMYSDPSAREHGIKWVKEHGAGAPVVDQT